jgi:hypothetical protein
MVVLASKIYVHGEARRRALDGLESLVADRVADLDVEFDVGVRNDDFPSVTITGEDATAARNLLGEEFGVSDPHMEPGETYVGTLEAWDDDGFVLDAGERVRVPASALDLGRGSPSQVRERFGLVQHLPLEFVYGGDDADSESDAGPTRLSDDQIDELYEWTRGPGRVNVNSSTRAEVRAVVNRSGHAQDIITVERLGLLEQSIICAEGTDPPGLLAAIGEYLTAELRCVIP